MSPATHEQGQLVTRANAFAPSETPPTARLDALTDGVGTPTELPEAFARPLDIVAPRARQFS